MDYETEGGQVCVHSLAAEMRQSGATQLRYFLCLSPWSITDDFNAQGPHAGIHPRLPLPILYHV
jgi:hypothetical protein